MIGRRWKGECAAMEVTSMADATKLKGSGVRRGGGTRRYRGEEFERGVGGGDARRRHIVEGEKFEGLGGCRRGQTAAVLNLLMTGGGPTEMGKKETLRVCRNRHVLFNNKTKDEPQKFSQGKQLLALVHAVVDKNGGEPYMSPQFVELKGGATSEFFYDTPAVKVHYEEEKSKLKEELQKSYEEQLKRMTETVDLKLKESSDKLAQQIDLKLEESSDKLAQQIELKIMESSDKLAHKLAQFTKEIAEQINARLMAEIMTLSAQVKSNDEMCQMRLELLETAHRKENEKQRQQPHQIVSPAPPSEVKTILLIGRTGNGKSATGNSILGRKLFKSMFSSEGVPKFSTSGQIKLENGQTLNVIDTPGGDTEFIEMEIARFVDLANDGFHAIVLVLSVRCRFSRGEEAIVEFISSFFGPKIIDYMIVLFTGGDQLDDDETLDDYLECNHSEPLKEILRKYGNRRVLFDNKTRDESKKSKQLKQFLYLVDAVVDKNGGKAYTMK